MRRKYIFIVLGLIGLTIVFSACKSSNKDKYKNSEFGNVPTMLVDSLKSIGQEIQQIEIDPTKDNVVKGKNGTVLYISANSIVDAKGAPVTSKITLELKENYSIADFVTSNLQTVHNGEILQTQGMIYFSAKTTDGTKLNINKTKPIRIEFPVKERVIDAKIFTGNRDDKGNMNWDQINEPSKSLIVYPIRFISQNRLPTECSNFYGITMDTITNEYYNYYGDLSKFENTILATREFKERYDGSCWNDVVKLYVENLDKNMWEIDEMIVAYFIKDSTERVSYHDKNPPKGLWGGEPTKDQLEAHEWLKNHDMEFGHWAVDRFRKFAAQKLTKIDPRNRVSDTTVAEMNKVFVAYDALEFGWVNVDYFYKDPKAENVKLIAKTNQESHIINLIIPSRNVILSGMEKEDKTYYFTKNEDGYNKLPKGEKAIIVCISIVNNKMHFAEKEIIIGQTEIETVELKETTGKRIKDRLNSYGS